MVDSKLNQRTLSLTVLIVILFTCGMFFLNWSDIPLGYARYENYGFSLLYPKLMYLQAVGLPNVDLNPSDFAGIVQCQSYWENKLDIFEVIWVVKNRATNAEIELEEMLREMSEPNNVILGRGEYFVTMFHGEEVKCIYIEVEGGGNVLSGVVGVIYGSWSSPGYARVYFAAYATFNGSATDEQMRDSFQTYLDGLSIQVPEEM